MSENQKSETELEEKLVRILAIGSSRTSHPGDEFLAKLRDESTQAFLDATPSPTITPKRRQSMLLIRSLAGLALTGLAGLALLWLLPPRPSSFLHQAVEKLANAESYRVKMVVHDAEHQAVGKPQLGLRLALAGNREVFSDGEIALEIDETENRASSLDSTSSDEALACLLLARILKSETQSLLSAKPQTTETTEGKSQLVYFTKTDLAGESIDVKWTLDAATKLLHSFTFSHPAPGNPPPFAQFFIQAVNEPIDDAQIKVSETLTEDGRIGKIADAQGMASLRPKAFTRWTPICAPGSILKPGDWVRTDLRGANALAVQLVPETSLILGPGTLIELLTPTRIQVLTGELEIAATAENPIEVVGPDGGKLTLQETQRFRTRNEKLVKIEQEPLWLQGFKGTTPRETLGSLVAKVDGRNVPLHVGYHKVMVEIRDQIARTTIEESFVNNTNGVLEGQFHFPLPQDASISGFGMWVGDQLVEADIVEKQRAREIYETILREKRDPGLLEWTGGNIFKARVYPIPARSEKRIKIVYTQVLPREGASYRYGYALQSELLRQHPLRELSLNVTVHSAVPLKGVTCPTHPSRTQLTQHSARVEFSAQEYSPARDFEVLVKVDSQSDGVTMIPHRRGDDGYFMFLLQPPAEGGLWQRDVLPNGDPLKLLVLADTSASMDRGSRRMQDEVLAALLGSLGPRDSFNLAACDVDCVWAFEKAASAEMKNVESARTFLAPRRSLGWTDLDQAFSSAVQKCDGPTHVIYLGDGILTTGDADGNALAKRLVQLGQNKTCTFHSIAVSSSYEPVVMRAIGSVGGGSFRNISGEKGPGQTAKDLLAEISRPALRNASIQFQGVRTARVYPAALANLPAGTQQIVLGRYLPEGADQKGEVIVSGTLDGKPVSYRSQVALKDAEHGNSFVPRLWARMYLDELLAQGSSQTIQDEIISLSEEFHIMTPYTSLLVLESDADRERFKVKRRFQMRDGERFFADARDKANYELVQQQMRLAGNWRIGLQRRVLAQLAGMGRSSEIFTAANNYQIDLISDTYSGHDRRLASNGGIDLLFSGTGGLGGGSGFGDEYSSGLGRLVRNGRDSDFWSFGSPALGDDEAAGNRELFGQEIDSRFISPSHLDTRLGASLDIQDVEESGITYDDQVELEVDGNMIDGMDSLNAFVQLDGGIEYGISRRGIVALSDGPAEGFLKQIRGERGTYGLRSRSKARISYLEKREHLSRQTLSPSSPLFPISLSPPRRKPKTSAQLLVKHTPEVQELAKSLEREESIRALTGGIEIQRDEESFDPRFGEVVGKNGLRSLFSAKSGWLMASEPEGSAGEVQWCNQLQRGVWSPAYELVLVRKAKKEEQTIWPHPLEELTLTELLAGYDAANVVIERPAEGQVLVIATSEPDEEEDPVQTRVLIDTRRKVILAAENRLSGKTISTRKFSDHVEVAGRFWPGQEEWLDGEGRRQSLTKITIKSHNVDEFNARMKAELAGLESSLSLTLPLPTLTAAKQAPLKLGRIRVEDHLVLLLHFAASQQWEQVHEQLKQCELLAPGKNWTAWLRLYVLSLSRRGEEEKKHLAQMAKRLATNPRAGEWTLAMNLLEYGNSSLATQEQFILLQTLQPVFERAPAYLERKKDYDQRRWGYLESLRRVPEAETLRRDLATRYPRDLPLQQQFSSWLGGRGEMEQAKAWIEMTIGNNDAKWTPDEINSLHLTYLSLLENQGRYADQLAYLEPIMAKNPDEGVFYTMYLKALIFAGLDQDADKLAAEWLRGEFGGMPEDAVTGHRLHAAVYVSRNDLHPLSSRQYPIAWHQPLADLVLRLVTNKAQAAQSSVSAIMQDSQFRSSEAYRELSQQLAKRLQAEAATLSPRALQRLLNWTRNSQHGLTQDDWKKIASAIIPRWEAEKKRQQKARLDDILRNIFQETGVEARIAYHRLRVEKADDDSRPNAIRQLLGELLEQPWTKELEVETLGLIPKIGSSDLQEARLMQQLEQLHHWTDKMTESHLAFLEGQIEKRETLTRQKLAEMRKENQVLVQTSLADRLAAVAKERQDELGKWMLLESLYQEARLGRALPKVTESCWKLLDESLARGIEQPPAEDLRDEEDLEVETLREMLRIALQSRLVTTHVSLATGKDAASQDVQRLLALCDDRIALSDKQRDNENPPADLDWRQIKHDLLIARDRPQDLAKELAKWVAQGDAQHHWQKSLAYLQAELGKLDEAIKMMAGLEALGELGPADYRSLAAWYQTTKQDAQNAQAKVALYKTMDDYQLRSYLQQRGQDAPEVNPDDLLAFEAYFTKATYPQEGLPALTAYYHSTRDFRLLAGLPDAVIGHSSGQVFPFLGQMGSLLNEIRDEATADEIVQRVAAVRQQAKSPTDLRALDLLEMLVERRAAQVQNQAGPHLQAALVALLRAEKRELPPGEAIPFVEMLADVDFVEQPELAREQLRIVSALHGMAEKGSSDRLGMADWISTIHWRHSRSTEAVDVLEAGCEEFRAAAAGKYTDQLQPYFFILIGRLQQLEQFARAEQFLLDEMPRVSNPLQIHPLQVRLFELYENALESGGATSLGKEEKLYRAAGEMLLDKVTSAQDQFQRLEWNSRLCRLFQVAHTRKIAAASTDLQAYAFTIFPALANKQITNHQSLVQTTGNIVREVLGSRAGLEFYIERMEKQPVWLARQEGNGWNEYHDRLSQYRDETKELGALEPRLLKIVVAEIKRDMETHSSRSREIYHNDYSRFWKEKRDEFARVAEEVLAERRDDANTIEYIAQYLNNGLDLPDRAIEILLDAGRRKVLSTSGKQFLVAILFQQNRYGEAIAVLEPLVNTQPEVLDWRISLMSAYFHTKQPQALRRLLEETHRLFHEKNRANDGMLATLAESCLENELFEQSVQYFEEAVKVRTDAQGGRTMGDSTLADYFQKQAAAYAGLKNTAAAVDKAAAAIVIWPAGNDQRRDALDSLLNVLRQSPNLDAYVVELDKETAELGQDKPILRKSLGLVYQEREKFAQAVVQYRLAVELAPDDAEIHEKLIASLDAVGDRAGALAQTIASLELSRRNLDLWEKLADRFTAMKEPVEAERANTSLVEVAPQETEGHARLAEIRQRQDRWDEAIHHWQQVARLRKLEPTGLLKLAPALLHQKRLQEFDDTLHKLEATPWPDRFNEELQKALPPLRSERQKVKAE